MLLASNTPYAPWTIIVSNDKKKARLNTFRYLLNNVEYNKRISNVEMKIDDEIVKTGSTEIRLMDKNLRNENLKRITG